MRTDVPMDGQTYGKHVTTKCSWLDGFTIFYLVWMLRLQAFHAGAPLKRNDSRYLQSVQAG